jgi:hypothetical protein
MTMLASGAETKFAPSMSAATIEGRLALGGWLAPAV